MMELSKLTGINDQVIDLIESKQTLYGPVYSLELVEFETLKTYIKIWPMDLSDLLSHSGKPLDHLGRTVLSSWIEQTHIIGRRFAKTTIKDS